MNHRNFQTFEAAQPAVADPHQPYANIPPNQFGGSFLDASQTSSAGLYGQNDYGVQQKAYTGNDFDDEPPLLEGKHNANAESNKRNNSK